MDALLWFQEYNLLYYDIFINSNMLESMPNEFIPKEILSRIVIINQDSGEYKRYKANLDINNNKNNLQYALGMVEIEDLGLLSGYIYTDINKAGQNSYIKLISAINNL